MKRKTLFLIDGSSYIYRAFYALPFLSNSKGLPTHAIYGFTRMLNKILKEHHPEYMAVAFDVSRKTHRTEKFKEYKANRPKMPQDLAVQIPFIKKIIKYNGIKILEQEGYEADDIIATLALSAQKKGWKVFIISPDKDILQIVGDNIYVYDPIKDKIFDTEEVVKRFGVKPDQIPDLLALIGDTADNIPGVKGIGLKTAQKILSKAKYLEDIYKRLDSFTDSIKKKLVKARNDVFLSKELIKVITDLKLDIDIEDLKIENKDIDSLKELFIELEFSSLIKELPSHKEEKETKKNITQKDIEALAQKYSSIHMDIRLSTPSLIDSKVLDIYIKTEEESFSLPASEDFLDNIYEKFLLDSNKTITSYDAKYIYGTYIKRKKTDFHSEIFDLKIAAYLLNPLKKQFFTEELSFDKLKNQLKEEGLWELFHKIEMPLTKVLAKMELNGVKIDKEKLIDLGKFFEQKLQKLKEEIFFIAQEEFNINSPKQLAYILFEKLKLKPVKKTKTGYSTDMEVLEILSREHPLPQKILEYRQLAKLKSTYVDALISRINPKTQRIHTSYNQTATATGRLSSSNPNLQNIPVKGEFGRLLRDIFIAEEGYVIVSADYSQIELRILAAISEEERLKKAFINSEDIHTLTACEIFNVPSDKVTPEMRRKAKTVNFGIVYGISPYGLSKELKISTQEAKLYIEKYFQKYPKVTKYIERTIKKAQEKGFVKTIYGRKRPIPELNSHKKDEREFGKRVAINTPIQGSAADIIKAAMIEIDKEIEKEKVDAKMILQVHDELLFEVREDIAEEFSHRVKEIMENVCPYIDVPLKVEVKIGKSWGEAH